jgi:hypothetical protein
MRVSFAFLALVLVSGAAQAIEAQPPGPGWKEANREDDFVIYTRDNEKVGSRDIVAITEASAAPKAVYAVVTDFENYAKFMPYTKEAKIVSRKSDTALTVYSFLSTARQIDRDAVPTRFADQVRRYYETLGRDSKSASAAGEKGKAP